MVSRLSSNAGDVAARRLREELVRIVHVKTGVHLSATETLEQLVRKATAAGVKLSVIGWVQP